MQLIRFRQTSIKTTADSLTTCKIRHAPNSNCSSKFDPNGSGSGSSSAFEFEFENYPINLAGIECLNGSPSIFLMIRNQL